MPKTIVCVLCTIPIYLPLAHAQCPVHYVIVRGRVTNPAPNSTIHVQLLYPNKKPGESAELIPENASFRIPIEFLTQSSRPLLANLPTKCGRKPQGVVVSLLVGEQERDSVSLKFPADFDQPDPSDYVVRSEVVLEDSH
ncbi:MAG: hypothetical protein WA485_05910 [Candidatus Sulfotelmatobacter sp.]